MDLVQPLLPELRRHLSTAFVLRAAVPKCGDSYCAPVIHCSGELTPHEIQVGGYSGYTLISSFILGAIIGGALVAKLLVKTQRKPSAATIALKKLA